LGANATQGIGSLLQLKGRLVLQRNRSKVLMS
jgi:hypothetical protein